MDNDHYASLFTTVNGWRTVHCVASSVQFNDEETVRVPTPDYKLDINVGVWLL